LGTPPGRAPVVATLTWLGGTGLTADALLHDARRLRPRDVAREFLLEFLHAGPRTSREVWQQGRREGHSKRTLQRAREGLEIRSERVLVQGKTICYWLLPAQSLPPEVQALLDADPLEPVLRDLRARYPSSTPLDDL